MEGTLLVVICKGSRNRKIPISCYLHYNRWKGRIRTNSIDAAFVIIGNKRGNKKTPNTGVLHYSIYPYTFMQLGRTDGESKNKKRDFPA